MEIKFIKKKKNINTKIYPKKKVFPIFYFTPLK